MKKIINMRSKCLDYEVTIGTVLRAVPLCWLTSLIPPPPALHTLSKLLHNAVSMHIAIVLYSRPDALLQLAWSRAARAFFVVILAAEDGFKVIKENYEKIYIFCYITCVWVLV